MTKRPSLPLRSAALLHEIAEHGPYENALDDRLVKIAGGGGELYHALYLLKGRFLIRWEDGGKNLRASTAGRELISSAHYRELLSLRSELRYRAGYRVAGAGGRMAGT